MQEGHVPAFMQDTLPLHTSMKQVRESKQASHCDMEAGKRIMGVEAISRWYKGQQLHGHHAPARVLAGRRARSAAQAAATGAAADVALAESISLCFAKDAITVAHEKARATVDAAMCHPAGCSAAGGGGAAAAIPAASPPAATDLAKDTEDVRAVISAGQILQWNHSDIVAAVEVIQARALPGCSEHIHGNDLMKQARGPCTLAAIAQGLGRGLPAEHIRKTMKQLEETEARSRPKRHVPGARGAAAVKVSASCLPLPPPSHRLSSP